MAPPVKFELEHLGTADGKSTFKVTASKVIGKKPTVWVRALGGIMDDNPDNNYIIHQSLYWYNYEDGESREFSIDAPPENVTDAEAYIWLWPNPSNPESNTVNF